jgi:hypothetical protein
VSRIILNLVSKNLQKMMNLWFFHIIICRLSGRIFSEYLTFPLLFIWCFAFLSLTLLLYSPFVLYSHFLLIDQKFLYLYHNLINLIIHKLNPPIHKPHPPIHNPHPPNQNAHCIKLHNNFIIIMMITFKYFKFDYQAKNNIHHHINHLHHKDCPCLFPHLNLLLLVKPSY